MLCLLKTHNQFVHFLEHGINIVILLLRKIEFTLKILKLFIDLWFVLIDEQLLAFINLFLDWFEVILYFHNLLVFDDHQFSTILAYLLIKLFIIGVVLFYLKIHLIQFFLHKPSSDVIGHYEIMPCMLNHTIRTQSCLIVFAVIFDLLSWMLFAHRIELWRKGRIWNNSWHRYFWIWICVLLLNILQQMWNVSFRCKKLTLLLFELLVVAFILRYRRLPQARLHILIALHNRLQWLPCHLLLLFFLVDIHRLFARFTFLLFLFLLFLLLARQERNVIKRLILFVHFFISFKFHWLMNLCRWIISFSWNWFDEATWLWFIWYQFLIFLCFWLDCYCFVCFFIWFFYWWESSWLESSTDSCFDLSICSFSFVGDDIIGWWLFFCCVFYFELFSLFFNQRIITLTSILLRNLDQLNHWFDLIALCCILCWLDSWTGPLQARCKRIIERFFILLDKFICALEWLLVAIKIFEWILKGIIVQWELIVCNRLLTRHLFSFETVWKMFALFFHGLLLFRYQRLFLFHSVWESSHFIEPCQLLWMNAGELIIGSLAHHVSFWIRLVQLFFFLGVVWKTVKD